MSKVRWPAEIPAAGIFGVKLYYFELNDHKYTRPQNFCNVDMRLFIALAAAILDGIHCYGLKGINTAGIYNDRNIRGGSTKSTHAYGLAIDITGFLVLRDGEWWVDDDEHKPKLQMTATEIMMPYFPDIITWDFGQWRGGYPHEFSAGTRKLHKNHYHINPTPWADFDVCINEWHIKAVERVVGEFGYPSIESYQLARGLKEDGIAGRLTCTRIVQDIIEQGGE